MKNYLLVALLSLPFFLAAQNPRPSTRDLYDPKSITEVRLQLEEKDWGGTLDSLRITGEAFLAAEATVDGTRYSQAGVRYIGDKSYITGQKRNPVLVKLDHRSEGENYQGYKYLYLSSALRDPSMIREVLFHEIAGKYMPSAKANYAKLYINGEYIGLFVNLELPMEVFQERYFNDSGNLLAHTRVYAREAEGANCKKNILGSMDYEPDVNCYRANFRILNGDDYAGIQELTRVLNLETKKIPDILEVDEVLWMHALNNVMVNLSSYAGLGSNYFLYRDAEGRFHPILWDLNLAFGSYKNIGSGSDIDVRNLYKLDPLLHADNPQRPLISQLMKEPLYKKMYLAHMRQIVDENFANGLYEKRAKELQAQIAVLYSQDPNKEYALDDFQNSLRNTIGKKSKIPGIVELMTKRVQFLKSNADMSALPSTISDVKLESRPKYQSERISTFNVSAQADRFPQRLLIYYRFNKTQPYQSIAMDDDASGGELKAGAKKYKTVIKAPALDAQMEYFIVAENAGAASFHPANYTKAPAVVALNDLNK